MLPELMQELTATQVGESRHLEGKLQRSPTQLGGKGAVHNENSWDTQPPLVMPPVIAVVPRPIAHASRPIEREEWPGERLTQRRDPCLSMIDTAKDRGYATPASSRCFLLYTSRIDHAGENGTEGSVGLAVREE